MATRLHVYLAHLGLGSRREIESWIKDSRIKINGKLAKLGDKVDPESDQVMIGRKIINLKSEKPEKRVTLALHKPKGVLSTVKDPEGRPTVMSFMPTTWRLYPIGRLDFNSEGLLLMTNDGDLAYRLTHPRFQVPKVYEVKIRGRLDEKKLQRLKRGFTIGKDKFQPAEVLEVREATRSGIDKHIVVLKVFEGKNHHVRRMFESMACRVVKLKRISIGNIKLKGIARGQFQFLSKKQIEQLLALSSQGTREAA